MKSTVKKRLIISAIILCVVGAVIAGLGTVAGAAGRIIFDRAKGLQVLTDSDYFAYSERQLSISSLDISAVSANISLIESDSWGYDVKVYYADPEISVVNGKLTIKENSDTVWSLASFTLPSKERDYIKIYYPAGAEVDSIKIQSTDADIRIDGKILSGETEITSRSGNLTAAYLNGNKTTVNTISGDITVSEIFAASAYFKTVSGNIDIYNISVNAFEIATTSGDIRMSKVLSLISAKTVSGNVDILELNGAADVTTTSGDITIDGRYLGGALKTVSGNVTIRSTLGTDAYTGSINTVSGFITFGATRAEKKLSFTGGEFQLTINTTSGDVTVE